MDEVRQDVGWRPIGTAPRDGKLGIGPWVLLYIPDCEMPVTLGSYFREEMRDDRGRFKGGEWTACEWDGCPTGYLEPTHWMPLPEPPDAHPTLPEQLPEDGITIGEEG